MKKLGIVTFQRALNYGALLQTYALQRFLREHFEDWGVETVDYFSPLCERECTVGSIRGGNPAVTLLKKGNFLLKQHRFSSFIKRNVVLGQRYDRTTIDEADRVYDCFITGSDQVFNPVLTGNDRNYLLGFAQRARKLSYAASVGIRMPGEEEEALLRESLRSFHAISVRERSAKATVDRLLAEERAEVHVDPTLLLTTEEWLALTKPKKGRENYVLVYQVKHSRPLLDRAIAFAKEKGMKVLYVGPFARVKGVRYVPAPAIEQLLTLFAHAAYVFENSFHGTVFSIRFKRRFYAELPFTDGRNDRIEELLALCGLSDRLTEEALDRDPDWSVAEQALRNERERALRYLQAALAQPE